MASYSVIRAKHATLSSTTADSITLSFPGQEIIVTNFDGTNKLYVTWDGTTPTAAADDSFVVPISSSKTLKRTKGFSGSTVVKVVGNGGAYSVEMQGARR